MFLKSSVHYTFLVTLLGNSFLSSVATVLAETPVSDVQVKIPSSTDETPVETVETSSTSSVSPAIPAESSIDTSELVPSSSQLTDQEVSSLSSSEVGSNSSVSSSSTNPTSTKPATSFRAAVPSPPVIRESRKAAHVRALLPLT